MSEELIPKNLKGRPSRSVGAEVAALNDLLTTINNPAITGAQVPAGEETKVSMPPGVTDAGLLPLAPKPPAPPTRVEELPDAQKALDEAVAKVKGPGNNKLIVLTGRSGVGKSYIQARLRGSRFVVANVADGVDYRALRDSGAELWHVMASEETLARRRSPAAARRPLNPLVAALDADATRKLAALPPGERLHIIWNDTAPSPYSGVYNVAAFLNEALK